jgi:hypothetical protein
MDNTLTNPHYLAYARAHDKSPTEMFDYDFAAWPGGCMCGFLLWISDRKQEFWNEQPQAFLDEVLYHDQTAWAAFLQSAADRKVT